MCCRQSYPTRKIPGMSSDFILIPCVPLSDIYVYFLCLWHMGPIAHKKWVYFGMHTVYWPYPTALERDPLASPFSTFLCSRSSEPSISIQPWSRNWSQRLQSSRVPGPLRISDTDAKLGWDFICRHVLLKQSFVLYLIKEVHLFKSHRIC
jgi:hypothetical protein